MAEILVAMSGGVDSSVAAACLIEAGHQVTGVTLKLWGGESDTGCCSVSDVDDARRVADRLGIDHHVFNFGDDFEASVVEPYAVAHAEGLTPNPCIECNRHLKFDRLARRARALGFESIATGHHARVVTLASGARRIARGVDGSKDQSYVLFMLGQEQLRRLHLPIGELHKTEVRARARELGLRTAAKPDSQDVCFITNQHGRADFLRRRIDLHPAAIVDEHGVEVGRVEAVELVTIGQRKGLGVSGRRRPHYAVDVDVRGRRVQIGEREALQRSSVAVRDVLWADAPVTGSVQVQTSAHGAPRDGVVELAGTDRAMVRWRRPRPRVAPGQSVVFYADDVVVGGGTSV